jgi:DNA-binding NarL/FixJ family response regulator
MSGDTEAKRTAQTMVVVADYALMRTSIVKFLKYEFADWDFVDMASTDHLGQARSRNVCLVALSVAGRNVESASVRDDLAAVGREFPKAAIALLSDTDDVLAESQALEMGVRGYFTNSLPIEVALAGIRLVLAGGVFCPHPLATLRYSTGNGSENGSTGGFSSRNGLRGNGPIKMGTSVRHDGLAGFTPRETDVVAELRLGHSNKAIAENLNMSGNTVKMHLQHIMRKLHVQNRTEVVVLLGPKDPVWCDTPMPSWQGTPPPFRPVAMRVRA